MIEIRETKEISELMKWREEVILNVFGSHASSCLLEANCNYYRRHIADGTHRAFVASIGGINVATGAVCLTEELPSPENHSGKCAYLMNIYVRKDYRRRGIAGTLIRHLVNVAKRLGCDKIYLESTDIAKQLYRECGFSDMTNMMRHED